MSICKYRLSCVLILIVILLFNLKLVISYEKTLRKIVRNQFKMVPQPFSDGEDPMSMKPSQMQSQLMFPGNAQVKTMYHKTQWPKLSTYLSLMESSRAKPYSKTKITKSKNIVPNELRMTRNTMANITSALHYTTENVLFKKPDSMYFNESNTLLSNSLDSFSPITSKFFPPADIKNNKNQKSDDSENIISLSSAESQVPSNFFPYIEENVNIKVTEQKADTIIIPYNAVVNNSKHSPVKSVYVPHDKNSSMYKDFSLYKNETFAPKPDSDAEEAEFLLPGGSDTDYLNIYNITMKSQNICKLIHGYKANIDAQEKFTEFDIEPPWASKRQYWNSIFDSRYRSLMRNPKWPPLKVILIPRTHVDTIWKKTFQQYHNNSVSKIISNIVKKMQYYHNLTFNWNEVSHLSKWWKTSTLKSRMIFRRLLKSGRLEITTGGWVEPDEATSHIFGITHQLIEGHQWLKNNLNYSPNVGWLTNSVTHSPTMTYLLSASGISKLVFTNLHYSWEQYLAEFQLADFVWQQNWDTIDTKKTFLNKVLNKMGNDQYPKHSVLTHYLQFNSAGFKACGPSTAICINEFDFAKSDKNLDINAYNIKEKAELLLEQYSKTGTITSHNVVLAPIGGAFRYESQAEFDYQYNNYQKISDFVNINREIYKATIEFGTPSTYFDKIVESQKNYPTLKGDFPNFADIFNGRPAYWTGYYTTRPLFKILLRRLQSTLRTTEILFSFAVSLNVFRRYNASELTELLVKSRESVARLMDRNVIGGTLSAYALRDAHKQILITAKDCWFIQEVSVSLLSSKTEQKTPYLQKYVYRDGEFMSVFRTVTPGDQVYVFNSLSHTRTEVVELVTRHPNVRVVDHNKKTVTIQINPVWRYNSENIIKISRRFFKIIFAIVVPPMTLELLKLKETYDATENAATLYCLYCVIDDMHNNGSVFPFNIQPLKDGDIKLESYKHKLIFDELTGFLKTVIEKDTNTEKSVVIDFGAFKSSDISGMFVFDADFPKPIRDILFDYKIGVKSKIVLIISGQVETQMTTVYGRLLKHTAKILNLYNNPLSNAIYLVSKVDYDISPKNRDLELFMSIQTDIANGYPPSIYTDNNGFQYTERSLNISRRIESNMYPITSMAYIQDNKNRLTFISDHAQGVTVLQEGQLVVMLDRRVLYNDGRGTNEGLADNGATYHRHIILLENFNNPSVVKQMIMEKSLLSPSLIAHKLAEYHNYLLDLFIINKYQVDHCHYSFLPLIKASFPCDVSVINYRVDLNHETRNHPSPNTALMILQKLAFSCQVDHSNVVCKTDTKFSLENILRSAKAVFLTNLAGTRKGVLITNLSEVNFATMEIVTLRIYF